MMMDDVLDLIDAVADRLLLYKIVAPTDGCVAMATIIVKTAALFVSGYERGV